MRIYYHTYMLVESLRASFVSSGITRETLGELVLSDWDYTEAVKTSNKIYERV